MDASLSHALALHGNASRIGPKVPGINAQPLMPSIGTDNWRVSASQRAVSPTRGRTGRPMARPTAGRVDLLQVPSSHKTGRERIVIEPARPQVKARARKARARADHAARLSLFG